MLEYPLQKKIEDVRARIIRACERVKRDPSQIELVLVTKSIDSEQVKLAYGLGIRDFGENKVQEFLQKKEELPADIRWHFIGHLQTNKVKKIIGEVGLIHSVDRMEVAREIEKEAEKQSALVDILIQVNISLEETKYGFEAVSVAAAVSELKTLKHVRIRGLMAIGPNTDDAEAVRRSFRSMSELKERLQEQFPDVDWRYLSMGMSSDFEIAIEEGANLLRIGSVVFGPRA